MQTTGPMSVNHGSGHIMAIVKRRPRKVYRAIHQAADAQVSSVYRPTLAWVTALPLNRAGVTDALVVGDTERAVAAATDWRVQGERLAGKIRPALLRAFQGGGKASWKETHQTAPGWRFAKQGLSGRFDIINPRVAMWAERNAAELVTRVSMSSRNGLRELIARAAREGVDLRRNPELIIRLLDDNGALGLDGVRLNAVWNYRRDQEKRGIAPATIEQRVANLVGRYQQERAHTIARHETMLAANAGQEEAWDQASDKGLIAPGTTREWLTAPDERVCPICRPMSGKTAPRGQTFDTPAGKVLWPPAHVNCRCTLVLVEPDL